MIEDVGDRGELARCDVSVRNESAVAISRYYGVSIVTCVPYDPESKGGSESSVKVAKADLVPTEYNLNEDYEPAWV